MAEFNTLYQRAVYYDIVFKRDVSQEVDFIIAVYQQATGQMPQSLFDLACGPAYHAREFARRGFRAIGLDLRPEMLQFAADQAAAEGISGIEWLAADMRDVRLAQPVDIAINVFDGIDCLSHNDDLIAHFRTIAHNLTPRGLYLIDVTHPRFASHSYYEPFTYSGERDGISVEIHWATNQPLFDPVTNLAYTELEMIVNDHGSKFTIKDSACERILCGQEIDLLARLAGNLKPIGWYGAYDLHQPVDFSPAATRMIAVLQKIADVGG